MLFMDVEIWAVFKSVPASKTVTRRTPDIKDTLNALRSVKLSRSTTVILFLTTTHRLCFVHVEALSALQACREAISAGHGRTVLSLNS